MIVNYHEGGFDADAPQQNKAEVWDPATKTYTRWNDRGVEQESRAFTEAETQAFASIASRAASVENERTIRTAAKNSLAVNKTFLELASPTAAQVTAQVKALTRQNSAQTRLLLGLMDETE